MPTLGLTRTRRALEYVGRHPIAAVWIVLQLNVFIYWRAAEPYSRFDHDYRVLVTMCFLNIPGAWIVCPLVKAIGMLLPAGEGPVKSPLSSDLLVVVAWILSAFTTYCFWVAIGIPGFRRIGEQTRRRRATPNP